jgi:imidazolonepropionase-like amidohydrolase
MRADKIISCLLCIIAACAPAERAFSQTPARDKRIVIAAGVVLDGKGRAMRDARIVVEGSKIVAIDPKAGPVDYDLRGMTVLPG